MMWLVDRACAHGVLLCAMPAATPAFVAVVHVADAAADTYEELTPANEKKVWKRPKLPALMASNNRDTLPDGTVVPRIPEKMYAGLVKRHETHEEMRRAATRVSRWRRTHVLRAASDPVWLG